MSQDMTIVAPSTTPFSMWLTDTTTLVSGRRYRHRVLKEDLNYRPIVLEYLKSYVEKAHEDALRHFIEVVGDALDPLDPTPVADITAGYPGRLDLITLQGYFGEVFAGLLAEHLSPFGESTWCVPAFLFRYHNVAFDQLERVRQTGEDYAHVPGRTGDDCIAFQLGPDGRITKSLVCEAKCTTQHRTEMIREAHHKISEGNLVPVNTWRVACILRERRGDPEAQRWVAALQQLRLSGPDSGYERCDLVCYVCGQHPLQRPAWMPTDAPHADYQGARWLEAVEVHLSDVEALVRAVYGKDP